MHGRWLRRKVCSLRDQHGPPAALVGQVLSFQDWQQCGETALDNAVLLESAKAGTAGFDQKGVITQARRGVAFAENGQAAVFAAQVVGKGEEVLQDGILHIG